MKILDMLGIVNRDYQTEVAKFFHDAPVESAEADGLHTLFLGNQIGLQEILGPKTGFVLSGASVGAESHERVAGLNKIEELFRIKVVEAIVIDECGDECRIIRETHYLEAFLARHRGAFSKIVDHMRSRRGRSTVSHEVHPRAARPGVVNGLSDLVDLLSVNPLDNGLHFGQKLVNELAIGFHGFLSLR